MIPPRRVGTATVHVEDDEPRVGRTEIGSSPTTGGGSPVIERARTFDDTGGSMPTRGPALPKPSGSLSEEFDDYGSELAKEARIWPAYVREAEKWDEDMVDGWNRSLDVILGGIVFGNFNREFSFVIESSKNLKQDPSESTAASMLVAVSTLRAIAEGRPVNSSSEAKSGPTEFTPPFAAVCVNTLWFLSLSLGVSVSLVAMLAKQWCYSYMSGRTGQPHVQARRRQKRFDGLKRWRMAEILAFLPILMHLSLSLAVYLWNIHTTVAIPVLVITALTFTFYAATNILPVGNAYCPYTTPLSRYIETTLQKVLAKFGYLTSFLSLLSPRHEVDTSHLPSSLSDEVTSRALGWLITNSQDTRSVDLALQAIAGADSSMPIQPLVQCAVVSRLVGRFLGCFVIHPKTGHTRLRTCALWEAASLYGRALAFVISNASDQIAVASEIRIASGTAQNKKVRSIDKVYSYLEEEFVFKNPNICAFGAANMSTWREFWSQIEWPWPNAPLTRTSAILERHIDGEIILHPSAVVKLVETMGLEAPRWIYPRSSEDRGRVAMCLVKLLAGLNQHLPETVRFAISATLAVFTLSIDDYPGGASIPSPESRANRARQLFRWYDCKWVQPEHHDNLLVFGLLGLLRNPEAYLLTGENITIIASVLSIAYRMNSGHVFLPFLPPSFNVDNELLEIVLGSLCSLASSGHFTLEETTRGALLDLLTVQSHTWAHNSHVYGIIAENLARAETDQLQRSCLAAIRSQWAHTPTDSLLKSLFRHGTLKIVSKLLAGHNLVIAPMAMHCLWMIISKTLELSQAEETFGNLTSFNANSALLSAIEDGLFSVLADLFAKEVETVVTPHDVDMWVWVLENLSQKFPQELAKSSVLSVMADFYDSNVVGETVRQIVPGGTGTSPADRLRRLHDRCTERFL